jgi:hypothetical protein
MPGGAQLIHVAEGEGDAFVAGIVLEYTRSLFLKL